MGDMSATTLNVVGISGSPGARSKSRTLLERVLIALSDRGANATLIDLATLPADALLGRRRADEVERALGSVSQASIVVASTPVYRATYSGLLKTFFDLLPLDGLAGKTAIAIATGGSSAHQLVIDHGLRPLFASVGAVTTPTGVYGTDSAFENGVPHASLIARLDAAVAEALTLSERIHAPSDSSSSTFVES
ncbi:MAG TPA: NAD(P)H-dependent oxidoreductase [Gemmatimonadaceae bacterium]|nr:NAD(P)H-dependent oxidoreductase [Gemmatimonadaceae bacterium]